MNKTSAALARQTALARGDTDDRFQCILELSSEWYWEQDEAFRFTTLTGVGIEGAGFAAADILGKTRWADDAMPVGPGSTWDRHRATLAARLPFRDFIYSRFDGRGEVHYINASGKPVFDGDGVFRGYCGIAKDITDATLAERLLHLEHTVTRCIAEAGCLADAIEAVIREICEAEDWECGDYWSFDERTGQRRILHSWGIDSPPIRRFQEQSRGLVLPSTDGNVGQVFKSGRPFWEADMTPDTTSPRAGFAREAGLRALFILPVIAEGKPLGAITFNSRRIREPDERFLQAVRAISDQVGQFLQRKEAEDAVRESQERFRGLTELSSDMYWEQDERYRFTMIVGMAPSWTRERRDLLIGKMRWEQSYVNMTQEDWARHLALLDARQPFRDLELCRLDQNGEKVWVSVSGKPLFDASGNFKGYHGVGKDITERKQAEERIQYLAHHDGLTGLPNRMMFGEMLTLTLRHARRYKRKFAVMFIDLDRFKSINDALGHEAGDQLLKETSARLRRVLRSSDIVARLGGDEFVVLAPEIDEPAQAEAIARKALSALMSPVTILGQECRVTASIGICLYPSDGDSEETLMKNADIAMYQAKEEGKNNYHFYSNRMNTHSFERLALESSLRRALERGEFLLHYQAKQDLKSGRITGVEALLRWRHPDLGTVAPAQFIPVAEETGLIVPIGRWVLKTACEQSVAWQRQGLPALCMGVNLSARQFNDEDLVGNIERVLGETGLRPELLELELTESIVMQNIAHSTPVLAEIKRLGVRLAIDDFGVGYSSLANLKRFPIDTLKVDRSLIRDVATNGNDNAIAGAIIAMGKTLSLTVVAEGVETQEQQAFLASHACDEMQGYYFSRPIEPAEFAQFLRSHTAFAPT